MDKPSADNESFAKELLLADHRYVGELLQKSEQSGETRVNLFITLITAGIGGLFALMSDKVTMQPHVKWLVSVVSLLFLLAIGFVTWQRMVKRDISTDRFKRQLDMIRETFKARYDSAGALAKYDLFPRSVWGAARTFGGLADTVALLNGFLAAGIVGAGLIRNALPIQSLEAVAGPAIVVLATLVVAVISQVKYADWIEQRVEPAPTHAGGVVYRVVDSRASYLLVRPRNDNENEWVLPKGHIECDETPIETAIREVEEEARIVASVVCPIDSIEFWRDGEAQKVKFFLMKMTGESRKPLAENRDRDWFSLEEAVRRLSYPESKCVLRAAGRELRRRNPNFAV